MNLSISRTNADELVFESDVLGPASVAGLATSSFILIRRERRVEKLIENTRVVTTLVYEPAGAIIPKLSGDCSLITSYDNVETFIYETEAQVKANPIAPKCETGNQARLLSRELWSYRPYGAVLQTVAASFPDNVFVAQVPLILDLHELETYAYDKPSDVVVPNEPVYDAIDDIAPQSAKLYGLTHLLKRWEPRGKVSPEDYLYDANSNYWINADEPTYSYELQKQWKEQRLNEWLNTERENNAIARAYPDASSRLRQKFVDNGTVYSRDIFTYPVPIKYETTISQNGNTQPPSPETMPSKVVTENATVTGKAVFPIDSDYPFRPKTLEITFNADIPNGDRSAVDAIRQEANRLASIWGKISWGRFKGISLQCAFTPEWWNYTPLDRVNIQETFPGIQLANVETSAYLGDGFAVALAQREFYVGIDGIYLGFLKNNQLVPPYKTVAVYESQIALQIQYKTKIKYGGTIVSTLQSQFGLQSNYRSPINPPSNAVAIGSSTAPYNLSVSWDEPLNDQGQPIAVAGYEVEYRVENGVYQGTKSVTTLNTIFTALAIGNFQARVRSVSSNGRRSVWVESNIAAITQQSSITAVIAQATTTTPQEGTVVNLSAIVNGLGSYSTAVTWTIENSSTAIGTLDTQSQTVTYTVPPSSAGMMTRLRATSVQDSTKFGEVVLNIQAAVAPPPGNTAWRTVGNVAQLLNSDRVYAGAVGLSQLTLPTNAPIFSEITIVNNGGSTGFEIIPPPGVSIVHQGVSQQDKLITTQNPASIKLLCTNAPNEWTVVEFSGVFAFINNLTLTIEVDLNTQIPVSTIEVVQNYTITSVNSNFFFGPYYAPGIFFPLEYSRLNDGNFSTGLGVTNEGSSTINCSLTFDLGSVQDIYAVDVAGGFMPSPWNNNVALHINGCPLQGSINGTTWTTIATVTGVSDNNTYTTIPINQSVRYLRLVHNGTNYLGTTAFVVYRSVST
jgi:hypothetical protein